MIHFIGSSTTDTLDIYGITKSSFTDFKEWESKQLIYQLDTETNVVDSIVERKLKLVQFGDINGIDQWVIQVSKLTNVQANTLLAIVNNPIKLKIIQNVSFEYQIFKKYGIQIENVFDVMLVEKILWCGYSTLPGFYGLKEILNRYLFIDISKELQTSFDCDVYSPEQITYAANDVKYLGFIKRLQHTQLKLANLEYVAALENEAVLGLAEIEFHGMRLDVHKWRENVALAEPIIVEANKQLEEFVRSEEFSKECIALGFLTDKESLTINWNSTLQKKLVFGYMFPDLQGITQPIIKKYLKREDIVGTSHVTLLEAYLRKDYDLLEKELQMNSNTWLIKNNLVEEADKVLINWQSPPQRLKVFKIVEPHLKSTDKQELADCDHPIIEAYQEYINSTKLKTSFGEAFIEKHVDSDGRVRTRFNQIMSTGRTSSSSPNCQNIPSGEKVQGRYRNSFVADKGWKFVGADYSSQELILIAYFSQDKVWLDALSSGADLHSVTAQKVFKSQWKDATEKGCKYYQLKEDGTLLREKCSCKKHKTFRVLIKTINYMLCYGGSKFKLSAVAKISLDEAQKTIDEYFAAFPGIKRILDAFGKFGVRNGFIMTSKPFNRRRYFDYWEKHKDNDYWMGKVLRASMNSPLQGSAADQVKLAMVLIWRYIKDNNLWNKVKIVANIHDELQCNVIKGYAEEWSVILKDLMEEATTITLPKGLLSAEVGISDFWSK